MGVLFLGLVYLFLELMGHYGAYGELVSCYSWEDDLEKRLRERWDRAGRERVPLSDVCLMVRFSKDDNLLKGVDWGSRWVIHLSGSSADEERVLKLLCDEFVSGDMIFSFASFSEYMRMGVFSMDAAVVRVLFLFTHAVYRDGEWSMLFGSAERLFVGGYLLDLDWVFRGDENRAWHAKFQSNLESLLAELLSDEVIYIVC